MERKIRTVGQIAFGMLLALSLSLVSAVPVAAVEFPSISPTSAQYDLDAPTEVMTTIAWGVADEVAELEDDVGVLAEGLNGDYIALEKHLIILNDYLKAKLPGIGDEVELIVRFDTGAASFTITAIGTEPSIDPSTAQYDLDEPTDVETTTTWGIAGDVERILDQDDYQLGVNEYTLTEIDRMSATLVITNDYLEGKLTDIGAEVELTIEFDRGQPLTFEITASGTQPSISPLTEEFDVGEPADVETSIVWGAAIAVISVEDDGEQLVEGTHYEVDDNTLIMYASYLEGRLADIGDGVELKIELDRGDPVEFAITAIGTHPSVSPQTAEYDLDQPGNVETTIMWGAANKVQLIIDDQDKELQEGIDYHVDGSTLVVHGAYLADRLKDITMSVALTIQFDVGDDVLFTIEAGGTEPRISPQAGEYDLDAPDDVSTTITWGTAEEIEYIIDDDGYGLEAGDYSLTYNDDTATLTFFHDPYLKARLEDVGAQLEITIEFDVGPDAVFTIEATGVMPTISPTTAQYDYDDPGDVASVITWGTASKIESIVDGDAYRLREDVDYSFNDVTNVLTIKEPYILGVGPDIGDSLVLTIDFDANDAVFTITIGGTHPSIHPATHEYHILDRPNVTATITWGSAADIVSIVDDRGQALQRDIHYTVTDIDEASATLTIRSGPYLQYQLSRYDQQIVLTVKFDLGDASTLTIVAPWLCFIATAAYDTPMAHEIEILREFRDQYMLTNRAGQLLVELYYSVSPPIALFITEHPGLQPAVRAGLLPAVVMAGLAISAGPAQIGLAWLLIMVLGGVVLWARRWRGRRPEYRRQ